MENLVGQTIGRYRIIEQIGRGGLEVLTRFMLVPSPNMALRNRLWATSTGSK